MTMFQQLGRWLMHNSFAMKNTLLSVLGLVLISTVVLYASPAAPTPVEVWTVGDDGLTQRLRDAVETKFKSSSDFALSIGKKEGTLIVTIPTNVSWTKEGTRTRLRYTVELSSIDDVGIGKSSGSCWDDNLAECASQIYRGAQKATHKCTSCPWQRPP